MEARDAAGETDYRKLSERMGMKNFRRRMEKQVGIWHNETHQGRGFFFWERFVPLDEIMSQCIRWAALSAVGRRNMLNIEIVTREIYFPNLPEEWDGYCLLQLADLHLDIAPELAPRIKEVLQGVKFDQAVVVGDFHNRVGTEADESLKQMQKLLPDLGSRPLGILGNHDFIEKVSFLEHHGMRMLMNEAMRLEREGSSIWMVGVDDPHFFKSDDLLRAQKGIPSNAFKILLSHSPELYREAAEMGFDLMLCGHTHGGQICLPGGFPIVRNADVPLRLIAGAWKKDQMQGYTSRGTGCCGVPARFFCRPEITRHILRRQTAASSVS